MKLKLIFCFLLLLLSGATFAQTKSSYEKTVDSLIRIGQQEKIIPYLEKEVKKYSKNENLLRLIGVHYIQINNLELGEKYYREALVVNPKCARCYMNIGRIYASKNDFNQAIVYLDKAVNTDPKDALIVSNRAIIKEYAGNVFGALADHNNAIELAPQNADHYTERGLYNGRQNYLELALTDFNKAIELAPNDHFAYFYRGQIYFKQNNWENALKDADKAITLNDKQYRFFIGRGAIYSRLNQNDKALDDYSQAIKLNPEDFLGYLNRAGVYYELENMDASCEDYTSAKALLRKYKIDDPELLKNIEASILDFCDESRPSYYYQRGVAHYNLKQYDKALEIYALGLRKFPTNAMILSFKGNAYLALRDYKKASINYALSLEYKENLMAELQNNHRLTSNRTDIGTFYKISIASIYYNNAECKMYDGSFDNALTEMNEALAFAPNAAGFNKETYYNRRGAIYLAMAKYELALGDFNKSIELNKNYALAYINRAIVKVSRSEKLKLTNLSISGNLANQPFRFNWLLKQKSSLQKADANIISALDDCNKAIALDKNEGSSYYVRGLVKQILGYTDYCVDLLTAKKMGYEVEETLLKDCNQ